MRKRTLERCFDYFMKVHSRPHKKTWQMDQYNYDKYLSDYGDWPIDEFVQHLREFHAVTGVEVGRRTANVLLTMVCTMLRICDLEVPRIRKFRIESRSRYLNEKEVPILLAAIRKRPEQFRDFVMMLLYTSARSGNVRRLRFEQIDWENKIWVIPGNEYKNGHEMRVPLCETALEILRRRYVELGQELLRGGGHIANDWCFPQRRDGKIVDKPMIQPTRTRGSLKLVMDECAAQGVTGFTLHDLRKTAASWLVSNGTPLAVIGSMLGHRSLSSTQIYAKLAQQPVADAVSEAGSMLDKLSDI